VRQIFRAFSRAEACLAAHYDHHQVSSPDFYLSSNVKMNLVEDLIDIFLGYLYDKDIKVRMI